MDDQSVFAITLESSERVFSAEYLSVIGKRPSGELFEVVRRVGRGRDGMESEWKEENGDDGEHAHRDYANASDVECDYDATPQRPEEITALIGCH